MIGAKVINLCFANFALVVSRISRYNSSQGPYGLFSSWKAEISHLNPSRVDFKFKKRNVFLLILDNKIKEIVSYTTALHNKKIRSNLNVGSSLL